MSRARKRRAYLRRLAAVVAAGGFAAGASSADECDATIYRNATRDGEETVEVPPGEAEITGESTCEPGADLAVEASKTGGSSPFIKRDPTTVGDTGGFAATFDFGSQDPGTTFRLLVEHDDVTLDTVEEAVVVEDAATPHPTPTPSPTKTPSPTPTSSPTPTPTDTASPTATPSPTRTSRRAARDETQDTGDEADDGTATEPPDEDVETGNDGTGDDEEATPTSTGAPGLELATAVGGLALAAWRLRDDR